jgi:hypothetical protein
MQHHQKHSRMKELKYWQLVVAAAADAGGASVAGSVEAGSHLGSWP